MTVSAWATPASGRGMMLQSTSAPSHALTIPALDPTPDGGQRASIKGTIFVPPAPPNVRVATAGLLDVSGSLGE